MYKIGITGSIGSGKTTIANMFALFKVPTFNADAEIKKILKNQNIIQKLNDIWPSIVKDNKIDKLKLRTIIFSNRSEKKKLEDLLYPYLAEVRDKFEKKYHNKKVLVYDVPLIYETKSERMYDLIILANCNAKLQENRVIRRDKISASLYKKILRSQMSYKKKMKFEPKEIKTNKLKLFILIDVILILVHAFFR